MTRFLLPLLITAAISCGGSIKYQKRSSLPQKTSFYPEEKTYTITTSKFWYYVPDNCWKWQDDEQLDDESLTQIDAKIIGEIKVKGCSKEEKPVTFCIGKIPEKGFIFVQKESALALKKLEGK